MNEIPSQGSPGGTFSIPHIPVQSATENLSQRIVTITEDKLSLILNEQSNKIGQKNSWHTPLGLTTTIGITLLTTEFKSAWLKAELWQALFILCFAGSLLWLLKSAWTSFKTKGVKNVVEIIMNAAPHH